MEYYKWDNQKNELLKAERGISFEQIVLHIDRGDVLAVIAHPNAKRYPNQQLLIVAVNGYAYLVPFVDSPEGRKATRDYLKGKKKK